MPWEPARWCTRSGACLPAVRFLFASTGEVYGPGYDRPIRETDPARPCSPYAASKLAGELAVQEVSRRMGLHGIIARCFQQTGPGQRDAFVVPALVQRVLAAKRDGVRHDTRPAPSIRFAS